MVIFPPSKGDCCGAALAGWEVATRRSRSGYPFHHSVQDLGGVGGVGVFQVIDIDLAARRGRDHIDNGNQLLDVFLVLVVSEENEGIQPCVRDDQGACAGAYPRPEVFCPFSRLPSHSRTRLATLSAEAFFRKTIYTAIRSGWPAGTAQRVWRLDRRVQHQPPVGADFRPGAARLHRVGGDARDGELQACHMGGVAQRLLGAVGVATLPQIADIVGVFVPDRRARRVAWRRWRRSPPEARDSPAAPRRRLPVRRPWFPRPPARPVRQRNARGSLPAGCGRSSPRGRRRAGESRCRRGSARHRSGRRRYRRRVRRARRARLWCPRSRMRRARGGAQQHRHQHAVALAVGGVVAFAGQQPRILAPHDRFALQCRHAHGSFPRSSESHSRACGRG